jgi:hypothetical protein
MSSEIIIVPSLFFMFGFIVYVITDGFRRRQQMKAVTEFHTKLLERLGSAKEFAEFFTSEAGTRFMDSLSSSEGSTPHLRILRSMQTGLVLLALGIGFFILLDQREFSLDAADGLTVMATAATAVGAALLVSTAMSFLLSKRLGLIERRRITRDRDASV